MKSVSIIGVGRVGGALALGLSAIGLTVKTLVARDKAALGSILGRISPTPVLLSPGQLSLISDQFIFITTQDSEIEKVAECLPDPLNEKPQYVFHTSGSRSSESLGDLSDRGYSIGSIHPLVSISDPELGAEKFAGAYFCIEGDDDAVAAAEKIVSRLGGNAFSIDTKYKSLYHASAVTACGHLVALIDVAIGMLTKCGLDSDRSKKIMLPLIESTLDNLKKQPISEALTGTFARGDIETLRRHVASLKSGVPKEQIEIYLKLGEHSLNLAASQGLDSELLARMHQEILQAEEDLSALTDEISAELPIENRDK